MSLSPKSRARRSVSRHRLWSIWGCLSVRGGRLTRTDVCERRKIAVLAALALFLTFPGSAGALDMGNFTSDSSCKKQIDPISTVFLGQFADWGTVDDMIVNQVGWPDTTGSPPYFANGTKQWIKNQSGTCTGMQTQRSLGFQNKHHTRLFQYGMHADGTFSQAPDGNYYVYADPHRDVKSYTGSCFGHFDHVPKRINGRSGFDQGALEIYQHQRSQGTAPFYTWSRKFPTWRHRTFRQCDGSYVGGDGYMNLYRVTGQAG